MRITKIETLKADGGWRNFSFLKLSTDEGLVGWSEYNEDFGATNATSDLIARFADIAIGMDPREVGKIAVSLRAITRMSIGGINHEAIAAIENACLDVKAKALGVPVCALFGGPFRDRVNLYWSHCGKLPRVAPRLFRRRAWPQAAAHARRHQGTRRRGEGARLQGAEDQSAPAAARATRRSCRASA